ncbi:MAG: SDR family oxidoreductase [Acidobacteriota bacterium]|nr:SDR family oxidoreductase [Acidobacteriota bacterium]
MNLEGQVAIITGASSGIGRGVAKDLAAAGMRLVITARRADRLEELANDLDSVVSVAGDLAEPTLPQRLIDSAIEHFGSLDAVFNNAGIMDTASIETADVDRLCNNARINFEAATRMAYTVLKFFKAQGSGYLITTSSILGTKVRPTAGVYAGSKFAIEALTEALRMEVAGSGVRVGCIEPGLVNTELQDHFEIHPRDMLGMEQPLEPADIARCVRFMLEQPPHVSIPRMMVLPSEQSM